MASSLTLIFPKERHLGEEEKQKNKVVIRLMIGEKKKKRWISLPLKSREEYLELCAVSCHFASGEFSPSAFFQNVLERTWNAGMIHWEQLIITSFWPGATVGGRF